jgi:hypothetical protein
MLAELALKLHADRTSSKKPAQRGRKISVILNRTNVLLSSEQTARRPRFPQDHRSSIQERE